MPNAFPVITRTDTDLLLVIVISPANSVHKTMAKQMRHASKKTEVKNIHPEQVKRATVISYMEILVQ